MPQSIIIVDPKRELLGKQDTSSWIINLEKDKNKSSIGIDQVRQAIAWTQFTSFNQSRRVLVVEQADQLTAEAQNALLKTLEEPQSDLSIVLLTSHPSHLLATIRSRCRLLTREEVTSTIARELLLDEAPARVTKNSNASWSEFSQKSAIERAAYLSKITKRPDLSNLYQLWMDQLEPSSPQQARLLQVVHQAHLKLEANLNPRLVNLGFQGDLDQELPQPGKSDC